MKMLTLAAILAALAFPVAAQSTAKVEPQPQSTAAQSTKSDAKASTGKSGAKATKAHAKHKTHKKKPAASKT